MKIEKIIVGVLCFVAAIYSTCEASERVLMDEIINSEQSMRQLPGSESKLRDYFSNAGIADSVVYAVIYSPMDCPRCEVKVRAFAKSLKTVDKDAKVALITVNNDRLAAENYNRKEGYDKLYDYYIYDVNDSHENFLSYSAGGLDIVYFLKVNLRNGDVIAAGDPMYVNDKFMRELVAYDKAFPKENYNSSVLEKSSSDKIDTNKRLAAMPQLNKIKSYPLEADGWAVSETNYSPVYSNGNLFFNDKLDNSIYYYRKDGERLWGVEKFTVDTLERDRYIDIPQPLYENSKRNNLFFYMANSPVLMNDSILGISYSIPKVMVMKEVSDDGTPEVGFFNAPVCVRRNFITGEKLPMVQFSVGDYSYFNYHYNFASDNKNFIMASQKLVWPFADLADEDKGTDRDPFSDLFYNETATNIACFNEDGEVESRFGTYDDIVKQTKTAASLTGYVYAMDGNQVYYSDGISGNVHKIGLDGESDSVTAVLFEPDMSQMPAKPDMSKAYTYQYANDYKALFNRVITEMKVKGDKLYALVRHGNPRTLEAENIFSVIKYDFTTGKREEKMLPSLDGKDLLHYALGVENDEILPFALCKSEGKPMVVFYDF